MFFGFFRLSPVAWMQLTVALLTGCTTPPSSHSVRLTPEAKRTQALELRLRKQMTLLQDLKERNLVLEKREHLRVADEAANEAGVAPARDEGISIASPAAAPKPIVRAPAGRAPVAQTVAQTVAQKNVTPISVSPEKTGEHFLYSKIIETYSSRNSIELDKTLDLLLKTYPDSVFADNAIYLSGLLAFEANDFRTALKQFDKLLSVYPNSNKAVAALFAKASIEKKTGHVGEAKRGFLQLRDLYPGSPEAARVSVELKLLESASLKHRES